MTSSIDNVNTAFAGNVNDAFAYSGFTIAEDHIRNILADDAELAAMVDAGSFDTSELDWLRDAFAQYLGFDCWPYYGSAESIHKDFADALDNAAACGIIKFNTSFERETQEASSETIIAFCDRLTENEAMKIMSILMDTRGFKAETPRSEHYVNLLSFPSENYQDILNVIRSFDRHAPITTIREKMDAVQNGAVGDGDDICIFVAPYQWMLEDFIDAIEKFGGKRHVERHSGL